MGENVLREVKVVSIFFFEEEEEQEETSFITICDTFKIRFQYLR